MTVVADSTSDSESESENETKNVTSEFGVEYTVRFDSERNKLHIYSSNPKDGYRNEGFKIKVDGYMNTYESLNLSANETWSDSFNITRNIDVQRDEHTVRFYPTGEETIEFNFTRDIDPSNTSEVPAPRITSVEVANGTPYGRETSVVRVTVENPAEQLYGTKLMVHTLETDHNRRADATAPPGGETTVQVPIEEPQGAMVAGEVRLYDNNLSDTDHGFDQREFVGEADGDTQVMNRTYEPARDPYGKKPGYVYENESMEAVVEDANESEPTPMEHVITGVGVLVFVLAVWWYRR
ncbi:hypothetical protein [Halostella pelagica]|uniref:hypothetical protein n=1 Tax=Halostella pelagica TaxID=2583824 RepID=UPI001080C285|nr:hypothetical protein [Halostella pelagica]